MLVSIATDDAQNRTTEGAFEKAFDRGKLVIGGAAYAELLAAPRRTGIFLDKFCEQAGIKIEWEVSEQIWRRQGEFSGIF